MPQSYSIGVGHTCMVGVGQSYTIGVEQSYICGVGHIVFSILTNRIPPNESPEATLSLLQDFY